MDVRVVIHDVVNEVAADEAAAARDDNVLERKGLLCHIHAPQLLVPARNVGDPTGDDLLEVLFVDKLPATLKPLRAGARVDAN